MAEIRLTHGVLCKLECTICMHQRRSSLFCWLEVHHSDSIFNVFYCQVVTKPPRRTSVSALTFVADRVPI